MKLRSSLTLLLGGLLAACAGPTATTTVTAAQVSGPQPTMASPAAGEGPSAAASQAPSASLADGDRVCQAESRDAGTIELSLTWRGASAKGTLRRVAPSGNVTELPVTAERHQGRIVADDVNATDLVAHAATVAEVGGKKRIRLGELGPAWFDCR